MKTPFRDWNEVVRGLESILEPNRPEWHFKDEEVPKSKDFRVVPMETAHEATRAHREKQGKFKIRRSF